MITASFDTDYCTENDLKYNNSTLIKGMSQ